MQEKLTIEAHAKINLTLDVTGKLPNGYHTVQMVMQSVGLCDQVTLNKTGSDQIKMACDWADLSAGEDNLAIRAARLFCAETGLQSGGVEISLEKHIPMQAGMAGGSADAAAVLLGMNTLFEAGCSIDALCTIGVKLGADVPYCIRGGTMLAEGIGEMLSPLPPMPPCTVLICKPPVGVPTPDVYRAIDAAPIAEHPNTQAVIKALRDCDLRRIGSLLCNVMEPVTAGRYPVITEIRETMLQNGALGARMSGSGSAVFGLYESPEDAETAYRILSGRFEEVFLTETV